VTPKRPACDQLRSAANAVGSSGVEAGREVIAAANANEVMREQLDYLIEHAGSETCGCRECERYLRARALLTEIFAVR
jgi:hypothetical protein